jgi:hypothetical protein
LESSKDIFPVIKSRRMRWTGHVTQARNGVYGVLVGKPEGRNGLTDLSVDDSIILKQP